jgi:type IV pilus assembly protein PilY1
MNSLLPRIRAAALALLLGSGYAAMAPAQTTLADQPVFASADVPGNLALALSVEYPTAISVANLGDYSDSAQYLGYFDPQKCYNYNYNSGTPSHSYFQPVSLAGGSNSHTCSGLWSGNFMNWAAMQTIDPFRWALTGGYRSFDTPNVTILEKAWGSPQGGVTQNYPYRGSSQGAGNHLSTSAIANVTPFTVWPALDTAIWGNGNTMVISGGTAGYTLPATSVAVQDLASAAAANTALGSAGAYRVYIRVRVCDASTGLGIALLESNCVQYSGNHYKPEGLLQQYANKIRFSAFAYLNEDGYDRQGGVMRAPMGYIGPTYPQPLSATVTTNPRSEWDAGTGVMNTNPDAVSAAASGVSQSGVMNYLNKFGEFGQSYKVYDNVSELYYAVVRYFENLGNVPEWTNSASATALDGFPAVTAWTDPVAYSCQKNFILGIGDDHTWYDYNVGGATNLSGPRPKPPAVAADTFNLAATWTTQLQNLEPMVATPSYPFDTGSTYYIAGLAYGVHVNDIRPDLTGTQTISTYWMDVAEDQEVENLNIYYLAAKYGGFASATINAAAPAGPVTGPAYDMTTPLTLAQWDTTGQNILMNGGNTHPLPDNYFVANNANAMVSGLRSAFLSIANAVKAYTTAFSFSAPNVTSSGTESFDTQYDPAGWSGTITASTLTFDPITGNPSGTPLWNTNVTFQAQVAGTGWQSARNIATWNGSSGVPFEAASLTSAQQSALTPSYSSSLVCGSSTCPYLNYLRGDKTNEIGSTVVGSTPSLRARTLILGDVVDAGLVPVGAPLQTFSDATNPGYSAFKTQWTVTTPRPTMVYAGANDGMLHGFLGTTGAEQFAYVPSGVYQGPNNTPQIDGLAQLGNPNYNHHYYVDGTPVAYDIDLAHTNGATGTPNWRTLLIGGLGKGGRSYYAIDVTDPGSMTSESVVAGNVLWEFTDSSMGYSFGAPVVVKTAKYGWVAILTSGYDNSDGYGYIYVVNPSNGQLLEKVKTPSTSIGLTQASAFVKDYSDDTADSLYVGDMGGQLWRFDLTGSPGSYPQPTLLATLTSPAGVAQPVTTAPLIEIHPVTRQRYVMVGTGKLLASTDVIDGEMQTFYTILDGTASVFNAVATPITRANLTQLLQTQLISINTPSVAAKGWYTDLGIDAISNIGWRVIVNPQAYNGIVTFSTLLTTGDACSPSGQSRVYALDYSTATSVLTANTTGASTLPFVSYANSIIDVRIAGANGVPEIIVGFSAPNGGSLDARVPASLTGTLATRLLNWREVPTVE